MFATTDPNAVDIPDDEAISIAFVIMLVVNVGNTAAELNATVTEFANSPKLLKNDMDVGLLLIVCKSVLIWKTPAKL